MDSPQELADRIARTVHLVRNSPYIPVEPTPKQWAYLSDPHKEILFGGAAGGGKSVSLLASALMYAHVPGYSVLLLRRTLPDLVQPGGLIPMSMSWLTNTDAKWKDRDKEWHFPGGGVLRFGYLETEQDKYRYAGGEYSMIGWDEVTHIPEGAYTFLFSRLRQPLTVGEKGVPLRVRATANPGGIYGEWVRKRFIEETHPDRLFIPATFRENPHLDQEAYAAALANLSPLERAQLEEGDWDITAQGTMFDPNKVQLVKGRFTEDCRRVRVWDLAGGGEKSDWTVGMLVAMNADGILRVEDVFRDRITADHIEAAMKARAKLDGRHVPILIEQEPGSAGKMAIRHLRNNVLRGYVVTPQRPTGHKVDRAMLASALCAQDKVQFTEASWNRDVLKEWAQFYTEGANDDTVDTFAYACHWLVGKRVIKKRQGESEKPLQEPTPARRVVSPRPQDRWGISTPGSYITRYK